MCVRHFALCKTDNCGELMVMIEYNKRLDPVARGWCDVPLVTRCENYLANRPCKVTDDVAEGDLWCHICYWMFTADPAHEWQPPPPPTLAQEFEQLNLRVPIAEQSLEEAMKGVELKDQRKGKGGRGK
jgi:hypothetical protein